MVQRYAICDGPVGTEKERGGGERAERSRTRRPCDVFVKRCRVGTKESPLQRIPRGNITGAGGGGREVTDKRESYKMGCANIARVKRVRGWVAGGARVYERDVGASLDAR